ncbi:hypothetical protein LTR99_001797 [Exophiala xenobiotica]|uniref:Apple domain-containing protein n=1 Tax=Vermiconidia calcicola TaxID=1690605 RepID=A0AAV9Q5T9_9PEZI|nr:hypothetical protein LTR96_002035 [Exophiala xenobiotica]KAK5536565.1 hypothetical protein LTR25_005239 [Vermiconidia calcicola]KAK5543294.1 hypothetical protein LTR23_004771 [Chaetothyriales sp. CCFEE 6169]KAK5306107.1 hypothetical protein LTR99_001797 [Exophiala xenobiotica]KAK5341913.1 hypothetical protein LTR98_002707 [Exophiala xenobiotica]
MDGLQVDDSHREKAYVPNDSNKMLAPHSYSIDTSTSTSPYQPPHPQTLPTLPTYQSEDRTPQRPRMPWGLSLGAYTILIIGITAVIMGAALSGGLGGALAAKSSDNKSVPTTTVTATVTNAAATATGSSAATASVTGVVRNYSPVLPAQVNTTALDCTDQATITSYSGDSYTLSCNTNYGGNDIMSFIAYTLDTCINACSNMNSIAGTTTCHGIMFNANMEKIYSEDMGNCWLKSLMASASEDGLPPSVGAVLATS